MTHGDKQSDAGSSRPLINLLEPLFTGAARDRQQTRRTADLLPPLRFNDPARFPPDSTAEPDRQAGHGDPLHAFLTPSAAAVDLAHDAVDESDHGTPVDEYGFSTSDDGPELGSTAAELDVGTSVAEPPELADLLDDAIPVDEPVIHPARAAETLLDHDMPSHSGSASPAGDAEPYRESSVATADETDYETENEDWRDEALGTSLGQAEPEDELPLLDTPGALSAAVQRGFPGSQLASASPNWPDPSRLDRMADRLEEIARSLRQHEAAGSLIAQARDPLGALITGYLLGYFEGRESRDESSSG